MNMLITDKKSFVPNFNGNRDLPDAEQVVVTYRIPDIALKNRLKPRPKFKFMYDKDGNTSGGETEVSTDKMTVVVGMLISIKNLSYENSKGVHKITNATELAQAPLEYEPLINEMSEEFSKELDRTIDEKN